MIEYGYAPHLSIEGLHKKLMGGARVSYRNSTFNRVVLEIQLQALRDINSIVPQWMCGVKP